MGREFTTHGEKMNAYKSLVGKPERKTLLGSARRRWADHIQMNLRELGRGYGMGLSGLG
jgi:hypothetical protein